MLQHCTYVSVDYGIIIGAVVIASSDHWRRYLPNPPRKLRPMSQSTPPHPSARALQFSLAPKILMCARGTVAKAGLGGYLQ